MGHTEGGWGAAGPWAERRGCWCTLQVLVRSFVWVSVARKINVVTLPHEIPLGPSSTQFFFTFSPPSFSWNPVPSRLCTSGGLYICLYHVSSFPQVALLDIDICGPSIPKIMGLEGEQVIVTRQNAGKHFLTVNCSAKPLTLGQGVSGARAFLPGRDEIRKRFTRPPVSF